MKILVTGATGFLGSQLVESLVREGHKVIISSRSTPEQYDPYPVKIVSWPLSAEELQGDLGDLEACIHLAGESIAGGRWTKAKKNRILDSRVEGTRQVVDLLRQAPKLQTFLCASAIGFYGDRGSEELTEASSSGEGFLAEVCRAWEVEANKLDRLGLRIVNLRTGIVLGRNEGLLGQLEPLFRMNLAGPLGSGDQFMSWIHVTDWVRSVLFCLSEGAVSGPVNLTAPEPVSNRAFTKTCGALFNQKFFPPAPKWTLQIAMGEMSRLALDSQYVLPQKLRQFGFRFFFENLEAALQDLFFISAKYRSAKDVFLSGQWLPQPVEEVFRFFSDENNLQKITPPLLNFQVVGKNTRTIQKGTLINYKLKIRGIPVTWQTLIETWNPPHSFSDIQLKGPYETWDHLHRFEAFGGGTLMKDRVIFTVPMGFLGRLFAYSLVKKDIQKIFQYRRSTINKLL